MTLRTPSRGAAAVVGLLAVALASCSGGSSTPDTGCAPGSLGCACRLDLRCGEGPTGQSLTCENNTCVEVGCRAGTEGCPCTADNRCGLTSAGKPLTCQAGRCVSNTCPAGAAGCACLAGGTCTAATEVCRDGYCQPAGCVPGELNCSCLGGACASARLTCVDGAVCADSTGRLGGPCQADGTCNAGLRCDQASCTPCAVGTLDCTCGAGDACTGGLACNARKVCAVRGEGVAPASPLCYTPCKSGISDADGGYRPCSAEGLLAGCLDGKECREGSCLAAGEAVPSCATDVECPEHQTCIEGRCYSTCERDEHCVSGKRCRLHVCRAPCTATASACSAQQFCQTNDGDNGFCMPLASASGTPQKEVVGGFEVVLDSFALSNVKTSAVFRIENTGGSLQTFTVRKRSHVRNLESTTETLEDPDDGKDCDPARDCPLAWLHLGPKGKATQVQSVKLAIEAKGVVEVEVSHAGGDSAKRWEGVLEVVSGSNAKTVRLSYSERPEGQWQGSVFYFANFGDAHLDEWLANRDDSAALARVGNAFVQRWGAFRLGSISWDEFQAVQVATRNESWRWASVKKICPATASGLGACYLYDIGSTGVALYSSDTNLYPIPTGVTEYPFAMNLRQPDPTGAPKQMEGRIESSYAMQYAGLPAVSLSFAGDPAKCSRQTPGGPCITFLDSLSADVFVGGRYRPAEDEVDCKAGHPDGTYVRKSFPWLVPGFLGDTTLDANTGMRFREECRDTRLPFAAATAQGTNALMAQADPIPDGRSRKRELRLLDGAMINQTQMVILFEERFASFLGSTDTTGFTAYGYLVLDRVSADLDTADANQNGVQDAFEGARVTDPRTQPSDVLQVQCSKQVLASALGGAALTATNAADLVRTLINGSAPGNAPPPLTPQSAEQVHYLCEDTGLFDGGSGSLTTSGLSDPPPNDDSCAGLVHNGKCEDGGPNAISPACAFGADVSDCGVRAPLPNDNSCAGAANKRCEDGGPGSASAACALGTDLADCGRRQHADRDVRVKCPAGSKVTFFSVDRTQVGVEVVRHACQQTRTCGAVLAGWKGTPSLVQYEPMWRCESADEVYCDDDRWDLRQGKRFFAKSQKAAPFLPLQAEIDLAFRYRTRFVNRTGATVGFAPVTCVEGSNSVPYCYDPATIEEIRERVDCLLAVWKAYPLAAASEADARTLLDTYLKDSFASRQRFRPDNTIEVKDGYERLNSELLIMLGDEAYTAAFTSRFDLAGMRALSFQGSRFEEGGVDLAGVPGYELYTLYMATQYYQEALDRFYELSPLIWDSLKHPEPARNFISLNSVVRYFDKVVRASTQKSRAFSEIARRYQAINRPDLARRVVERAYTSSYLESVVMSRLMVDVVKTSKPEEKAPLLAAVEDAQRRYRATAADMRKVYGAITDNMTAFGFAPDYVPLPALDLNQPNAFELVFARAQERARIARDREDQALAANRSYETDAAQFQSELARIRQTYESQLGNLCGTFKGSDGRVYPATGKYAALNERASLLGAPCGLMGNGQIHEAMAQFELMQLDMRSAMVSTENVLADVEIERRRVSEQCGLIADQAEYVYAQQGVTQGLHAGIGATRLALGIAERTYQTAQTFANLAKCSMIVGVASGGDCPTAGIASAMFASVATPMALVQTTGEAAIYGMEQAIAQIDRDTGRWQTEHQCSVALVDSNARTMTTLLRLKELEVEMLKAQRRIALALSEIQQQQNEATRLQLEQSESEQLAINVEAARNDPNVRIYKNDAILNADYAFDDALREAYRATKVFEYYTSQSWAGVEQLYLVRMVARGDYNLENYLLDLQNAFTTFEETYGNPDTRVQILSLRDDVLAIPRLSTTGAPLSQAERIDLLRAKLKDVRSLDESGYLSFPFSTSTDSLSPLTRNHKVLYVEAEIIGSDVGDTLGRVYLRQQGTGVVRGLTGSKAYYRMPERVAVVNPFFNGQRIYTPDVYRTYRLRDRPYANTAWRVVLNQRDELANKDIDLQSLTDLRLHVYYTDFTQ